MLFVKETVRLYKTEIHANHAKGALQRYGWEVKSCQPVPVPGDRRKRKVWEIRAIKGWAFVIKLLDAWEAAKAALQKPLTLGTVPAKDTTATRDAQPF